MEKPTMSTKKQSTGHPIEIAIGPPFCQAKGKAVNVPARTEMIVNEIAKLVNPLQARESSCLYPSSASCCSSRETSGVDIPRYLLRSAPVGGCTMVWPPDLCR